MKKEVYNFTIGNDTIEIADSYKYLGVIFLNNGNFIQTRKMLRDHANRAVYVFGRKIVPRR